MLILKTAGNKVCEQSYGNFTTWHRLMCEINISDLSKRKLIFRDGLVVPRFLTKCMMFIVFFGVPSSQWMFWGVTIYLKCFMKMVNNFPKVDEPVGPDHPNSLLALPSKSLGSLNSIATASRGFGQRSLEEKYVP